MVMGIVASLSKNQKKQWTSFPISLGIYSLLMASTCIEGSKATWEHLASLWKLQKA
jgi:hypothetical protein